MKVILYMATTVNGLIAKEDDTSTFISQEESRSYCDIVKKAGALIIGRRTYNILSKQPEFQEFGNVKIIVVSTQQFKTLGHNQFIAESPKAALALLKDFDEVIVAGGSILNSSFIENNLIDEIYLDIEPAVLGGGIPLFKKGDFDRRLRLLGTRKISQDEIQLHYEVIK